MVMSEERKNADRAFEIMGVYFANCYWNRLYKTALDQVTKGDIFDINESYKITVERYSRGFGRQESKDERVNQDYTAVLADLKSYYEDQINKLRVYEGKSVSVRLSDRDFIDTMSRYILPRDEYERLTKYDIRKDKNFRMVMTQSIAQFTLFVIRSGVQEVIDKQIRENVETSKRYIRSWCDKFISIITNERDQLCNLILASRSGIDLRKENMDSVPKMVVDLLQEEMRQLIDQKNNLEKTINKYAEYAEKLKKLLKTAESERAKLVKSLQVYVENAKTVKPTKSDAKHAKSVDGDDDDDNDTSKGEIVGNTVVKEDVTSKTHKIKVKKAIETLEKEEYSGEEYLKPPEPDTYLEEAAPKSKKLRENVSVSRNSSGSSYDSDEVLESAVELSADE
jgi:hypothetical protein